MVDCRTFSLWCLPLGLERPWPRRNPSSVGRRGRFPARCAEKWLLFADHAREIGASAPTAQARRARRVVRSSPRPTSGPRVAPRTTADATVYVERGNAREVAPAAKSVTHPFALPGRCWPACRAILLSWSTVGRLCRDRPAPIGCQRVKFMKFNLQFRALLPTRWRPQARIASGTRHSRPCSRLALKGPSCCPLQPWPRAIRTAGVHRNYAVVSAGSPSSHSSADVTCRDQTQGVEGTQVPVFLADRSETFRFGRQPADRRSRS